MAVFYKPQRYRHSILHFRCRYWSNGNILFSTNSYGITSLRPWEVCEGSNKFKKVCHHFWPGVTNTHLQRTPYLVDKTSVGRFSLFLGWEPTSSSSYIMLWEPDQFSYIYIYIYRLVRANQVLKIFIFSKFNWFPNRVVFAYMIKLVLLSGSHNLVLFFRN